MAAASSSPTLSAKIALARAVGAVSRRSGRGGTSLPGRVLLRLDDGAREGLEIDVLRTNRDAAGFRHCSLTFTLRQAPRKTVSRLSKSVF